MSSDLRLKRLGLDHLKDDPKALQEALDKLVKENKNHELLATLTQLEALSKLVTSKEKQASIEVEIETLREQIKYIGDSDTDDKT